MIATDLAPTQTPLTAPNHRAIPASVRWAIRAAREGAAVRSARVLRGWPQKELAQRAGLPQSTMSALEAGRLSAGPIWRGRIARALGCAEENLFSGLADDRPNT